MPDPTPPSWDDAELVMISALEHWSYCPRQCALIHVEQTFDENLYTLKGRMAHERVDQPEAELRDGVRVERAMPLWSQRLGLVGKADVVEFHGVGDGEGEVPFPVEYKHGPRRRWGHDDLQLCAQGVCLEEMMGRPVPGGAVYHHGSHRRRQVTFTAALRERVAEAVREVRQMLQQTRLPPAVNDARCTHCSLKESCLPAVVAEPERIRSARGCCTWFRTICRPNPQTAMHQLLNTLYVQTQRAYLHLDHETLKVKLEGQTKLQVPLHHLGAVVCFGDVAVSTALLHRCAEDGRSVVLLEQGGRFKARLEGPVSGNVLLRRAQHQALAEPPRPVAIARAVVAGKIQNSRQILLRGGRETSAAEDGPLLQDAARHLAEALPGLETALDLDQIRGIEGDVARNYFAVLDRMVKEDRDAFRFTGRSRRPPRDRMNALLSFLYTLLLSDCVAAAEGVGLDPQVGFLHVLRPGRPALGLDLMEELRSVLADRLALTLINRKQLTRGDFEDRPGGAVSLSDTGRRTVVVAYQERKQEEVHHPVVDQRLPLGLIPHVQARLLARHLRDDLDLYPPYLYR